MNLGFPYHSSFDGSQEQSQFVISISSARAMVMNMEAKLVLAQTLTSGWNVLLRKYYKKLLYKSFLHILYQADCFEVTGDSV